MGKQQQVWVLGAGSVLSPVSIQRLDGAAARVALPSMQWRILPQQLLPACPGAVVGCDKRATAAALPAVTRIACLCLFCLQHLHPCRRHLPNRRHHPHTHCVRG